MDEGTVFLSDSFHRLLLYLVYKCVNPYCLLIKHCVFTGEQDNYFSANKKKTREVNNKMSLSQKLASKL